MSHRLLEFHLLFLKCNTWKIPGPPHRSRNAILSLSIIPFSADHEESHKTYTMYRLTRASRKVNINFQINNFDARQQQDLKIWFLTTKQTNPKIRVSISKIDSFERNCATCERFRNTKLSTANLTDRPNCPEWYPKIAAHSHPEYPENSGVNRTCWVDDLPSAPAAYHRFKW